MEYLTRSIDTPLAELVASVPVVVLDGARASGKTTSALRQATSVLRFPQDLPLVLSDPDRVLGSMERPTLIDEWQLGGTDLLWAIKAIVDADPQPGMFILTGSVEPEAYGPTYPLTGRSARLILRPMNRREQLGHGADPSWVRRLIDGDLFLTSNDHDRTELDLLGASGFPGARPAADPRAWLRAYGSTVAERSVDEQRDPIRVARLLRVIAELTAQAVPDETLWRAADLNRETLLAYRSMLERTHVLAPLPAWDSNRLKRITSYPKQHHIDTALALALANIDVPTLENDHTLAGRFVESFVVEQLRPDVDAIGASMHHLRTRGGDQEVDVVIDVGGKIVALDAKAGVNPTSADGKHLRWLRDRLGDRFVCGVVAHRGTAAFELSDRVWALPISTMW